MKQQHKKNIIKVAGIISVATILLSLVTVSFAYYTNTAKYFQESIQADGHSGEALERDANDFIIDGCGSGTILDTVTGLCWLKNMNTFGTKTWSTALTDCSTLNYAGHDTWELPTRAELFTLINQMEGSVLTCTTLTDSSFGFTNCQNNYYWSSTEYSSSTSYAWSVSFDSGSDFTNDKTDSNYVTCVVRQ